MADKSLFKQSLNQLNYLCYLCPCCNDYCFSTTELQLWGDLFVALF